MVFVYILIAAVAALLAVLLIRTVRCKQKARHLAPEKENVSKEQCEAYAERLAQMIRCQTVSVEGAYDDTEFAKLREVVERLFPLVTAKMEKLTFSEDCWLFRLAGRDTSRNMMVMSHHDVATVSGSWEHAPFGGEIADDRLWGRGTVDTKTPLFAELSALEELLAEGFVPPCNVYLCSSHNEEIAGDGAPEALRYFEENHITFELILDEGGAIIDAPMGGIECKCAMMAIHEKGRFSVECTAAEGAAHTGLAANPETPVVRMSRFITDVNSKNRFIRRMYPEVRAMFEGLAPYSAFPLRLIFANLWLFAPLLKMLIPKINAQAAAMIGTMCSFTEVHSGKAGDGASNVCTATASLRCVNDADLRHDLEAFRQVAAKYGVTVEEKQGNEYHRPADFTREQFAYVQQCIGEIFPHVGAAPFILPAGTDARHFSDICPCVVRFAPIDIDAQQYASVHSPNENISLKAIGNAVAFYKHFLKNYP